MKRTTILPILGLTCLSASILQVSAQTVQDGFGKASEGWQMEARPDTFEFKKASDIDLKFARWNVSGQDESFLLYDAEKMLHLEVVKDNGDPVPLTEHGKDIEAARGIVFFSSFVQVKPGESKEFTLALNKLFDVSAPGVYFVTAYINVSKLNSKGSSKLRARTFRITVR